MMMIKNQSKKIFNHMPLQWRKYNDSINIEFIIKLVFLKMKKKSKTGKTRTVLTKFSDIGSKE